MKDGFKAAGVAMLCAFVNLISSSLMGHATDTGAIIGTIVGVAYYLGSQRSRSANS